MKCHRSSALTPGARLVVAMAPALTIGLVRPPPRSMAASELNGNPVAFAPSLARASSGPITSQTSANTNGFDTLMMENWCSMSPAPKTRPLVPGT